MMAGRDISTTKLAFGSTRVMGTCAVGGQAAGTAAAMAARYNETPRVLGERHIQELRQELLKDDCFIPGCRNTDPKDLARDCIVSATSERPGFEATNVISGISRTVGSDSNLWVSEGIGPDGERVTLTLPKEKELHELRLTFDPDLSAEICISVSKAFIDKEKVGVPASLVRDYDMILSRGGKVIYQISMEGNYQRHQVITLPEMTVADSVTVQVKATNGAKDARIFEIRLY